MTEGNFVPLRMTEGNFVPLRMTEGNFVPLRMTEGNFVPLRPDDKSSAMELAPIAEMRKSGKRRSLLMTKEILRYTSFRSE